MSGTARNYVCDNGHEFGVTNWGSPPLACPRCRASYKPKRQQRKQGALTVNLGFAAYGLLLAVLIGFQI